MKTYTKGIILRYFKYGENSIIAHIYTQDYGRQSFIFKGAKSQKNKRKQNFIQPLFLIDIPISYRDKTELYTGNNCNLAHTFISIPFNHTKSAMAFFLAEFLSKILTTQERDDAMFSFLENAILHLDHSPDNFANFHLFFLIKLMKYIGIQPSSNRSNITPFLSITEGEYVANESSDCFDTLDSEIFDILQNNDWEISQRISFSRIQRNKLLNKILEYYQHHTFEIHKLKSLDILKELFD